MWFKLATADFSGNNLGTMDAIADAWTVNYSITGGLTKVSCPGLASKGGTLTATLQLSSGAEMTSVNSTSGSATYSVSGTTVTITVTGYSDNFTVTIVATGENVDGGSGGEGGSGGTVITYTSRQSSSGISKSTGEYLSSTTGYVNIYENIDPTKTYAATGYAPASTGDNACVCYYTSDGAFINAESGSDWGISSVEYTMHELTIPSNASIIKLFGRTNNQESVLYLTSIISLSEISYSSQKTSSNLSKTTGEYGSSSTGYVNIYDNIDVSKTYYGSGFCPNASGTAAAVCYYTSSGTFISAQDGNDFGVSSAGFVKQKLTVPSTTSTIKIFAQQKSAYPNEPDAALYVEQ